MIPNPFFFNRQISFSACTIQDQTSFHSLRALNTELRSKLRQRAVKNDRVVGYYAGQGQDDKVEGSRTMGYLLPADGELDNIPGTGISMGVIKELADALPAK